MGTVGKQILLVDDEAHLRETLGDYLTFAGFNVTRARDGKDALMAINKTTPDLIILDIRMPRMGGLRFLRAIAGPDGRPKYPVLITTAVSAMEDFFGSVNVDGFIAKPYDEAKLLAKVRQIIAKRADVTELSKQPLHRVLVAEDDSVTAEGLQRLCTEAGCQVEVAGSGPEAIGKAVDSKPDVLVLKELLPGMNGSTVARIVNTMPSMHGIPVLVYDVTRSPEEEKKFPHKLPEGVNLYLLTADPATIVNAVTAILASVCHQTGLAPGPA